MEILTKKQVAKQLNISTRTIDRLILSGQLKAYKIGRSVRIAQAQLDEFLKVSTFDPLEPGEVTAATGFSF
jgi:excisionase family DNA binding protein